MYDYFIPQATEKEIAKERAKARELRKSKWWHEKISHGECYYCGTIFKPEELTMDHVVPLIRGGKSTKNNIVPACKECNNAKKHKLPIEWAEYLENIKKQ
ncbi:MAG: HNH endonuclease [Mollicutes bacterium]|nr:HNH endonuclease [Mollicutes bacterium]